MEIDFADASFRYRKRDGDVFAGLTLNIQPGKTILLGPNGSGKSTLLGVAASVLALDRGRVTLGGVAFGSGRSRRDYRRLVAWMPQDIRPASGLTAREQVALHGWLAGQARDEAWTNALAALEKVDLAHMASRKAARLSGGQRARMGLAQALVKRAPVLLLDEPTAALDPAQKALFCDLLEAVTEERTVVVSTHDVTDLARIYDRVVVLDEGDVKFSGTTELFLRPGGVEITPLEAYRTVTRME